MSLESQSTHLNIWPSDPDEWHVSFQYGGRRDTTEPFNPFSYSSNNVPHGYKIVPPLAIGYPDESPNPRPRMPLEDIVYYEEFGQRREK